MKAWWACVCIVLAGSLVLAGGGDEPGKKSKGDVDAFFKKLDGNMDGKLSKDEFLKMAERAKEKEKARQKLSQAYDKIDPEKKGISKDSFRRYYLESAKNNDAPNKSK